MKNLVKKLWYWKLWLRKLLLRGEYDVWPEIVQEGKKNPEKKKKITYLLEDRLEDNIQATTEQYCVYCSNFSDPNFGRRGYDGGSGYCREWNGGIDIKASCVYWQHNTSTRPWLLKREISSFMSRGYTDLPNRSWLKKNPWYQTF